MIDQPSRYFDFTAAFKATKAFIDDYNVRQTLLTDKLNANQRATAEIMLRLYLKQLNKAVQLGQLRNATLPGFQTYNESLAKCKGCTKRTIMNHRERLCKAGFITKERQHGSGGLELHLNPYVLGKEMQAQLLENNILKTGNSEAFEYQKAKNFHPLVHEQQEQINNNNAVDKNSGMSLAAHGHKNASATGTRHEPDKNTVKSANPAPKQQKFLKKQLETEKQEQVAGAPQKEEVQKVAGRTFLLSLIKQFWLYARKVLYPDLILSEPEEREILNHIWASVYGKLHGKATEERWLVYQNTLHERIGMVARWLVRNPAHWIPRPDLYFHPGNEKNGFQKTQEWFLRQETLKLEI
ncbi:MAG: hypothetical protein WBA74_18320, partial [Cyclobacteriaceae bacterium]